MKSYYSRLRPISRKLFSPPCLIFLLPPPSPFFPLLISVSSLRLGFSLFSVSKPVLISFFYFLFLFLRDSRRFEEDFLRIFRRASLRVCVFQFMGVTIHSKFNNAPSCSQLSSITAAHLLLFLCAPTLCRLGSSATLCHDCGVFARYCAEE